MTRGILRAICTLAFVSTVLITDTGAVSPPRPGTRAEPPAVLATWPSISLDGAAKSGHADVGALVLPAGFDDLAGVTSLAALEQVFTGPGSVADYWDEVSGGRMRITSDVAPWQRVDGSRAYYAGDDNGLDMWSAPHNAGRFVLDAVSAADARGLDWGRYDNDGPDGVPNSGDDDGTVDMLIVVHAGPGGECGTSDLWSHQYFLAGWGYGRYTTRTGRPGGGFVEVDDYVLVPERSCEMGVIEIGVICHETGHLFGLPDLYDTRQDRAGIGGWGLMGTGAWGGDGQQPASPSWPCAWSRTQLGWATVREVSIDGPVTIADEILSVRDPDQPAGERWLIENRRRSGYDRSLPAAGLLIWHVDDAVIDETRHLNEVNAGEVLGVALEAADGRRDLVTIGGNRGDPSDPWPGLSGASRFSSLTAPSSDDNTGASTRVALSQIPLAAGSMTFEVAMGVEHLDTTPPELSLLAPLGGEQWTLGDVHTLRWSVSDDEAMGTVDLHLSRDGGQTWPRRLASDLADVSSWSGTLTSEPGDALRIRATARDAAGNVAAAVSEPFALVDRYAPAVELTWSLDPGAQVLPGDLVTVSWAAADNVGVASVDLEVSCDDGTTWETTGIVDQPAISTVTWTVPDRACPITHLQAVARDAAGNVATDQSSAFAIAGTTTDVPGSTAWRIGPCVPNPFNPRATIHFSMPAPGRVRLIVHDLRGRRVETLIDGHRGAGPHTARWDGRDTRGRALASGIYYVSATGPAGRALLKITLVR